MTQAEKQRRWYYKNHEANRAKRAEAQRRWREANPERHREISRRSRQKNRHLVRNAVQAWIAFRDGLKLGKPCAMCQRVCGEEWGAESFDWDHLDPAQKLFPVSKKVARALVLAEIAKCQLLCANCHRRRTRKQRTKPIAA